MIAGGLSIELNTYALIRPTVPGQQTSFCILITKNTKWEVVVLED